jgi:hypothetical protein
LRNFDLSTDEGSFSARTFVVICLFLVLNKGGQMSNKYLYLFGFNEAFFEQVLVLLFVVIF